VTRQKRRRQQDGRPPIGTKARKLIAFRLDQDVQRALKRAAAARGIGYHTLINDVLAAYVATENRR